MMCCSHTGNVRIGMLDNPLECTYAMSSVTTRCVERQRKDTLRHSYKG